MAGKARRTAAAPFERALRRRGHAATRREDGGYDVRLGDRELRVSIENLQRDYARDGDPRAIEAFVDGLERAAGRDGELPAWTEARRGLRLCLESADAALGDALATPLTPMLRKQLVYTDADERLVSWVTKAQLRRWKVTRAKAEEAAAENLRRLLEETPIEVEAVAGGRLAMFRTTSPFKASLLLSPDLKRRVKRLVGWPVLAVAPCRDFLYVLAETDEDLLGRLGAVVVREHSSSGYPLSTEVLRVGDDGIRALGRFG